MTETEIGESKPSGPPAEPTPDKSTSGASARREAPLDQDETPLVRRMKAHEVLLVLMTRSHQQARMMGDMLEAVSEIRRRFEEGSKAVEGNTKATLHQSAVLARIQTELEAQGKAITDMAEHAENTVALLRRVTLVVQVFAAAFMLLLIGYFLLLLLGR